MTEKDNLEKQNSDNPIVPLVAPFEDDRGKIQTILVGDIKSVQVITSKKKTVRANHYHKSDSHHMYVIKGAMKYFYRPAEDKSEPQCLIVNSGQMVFTPPMVEHAVEFIEDSEFINITGKPRDQVAYEDDLVRVDLHKLSDEEV